MVDEVEDTFDKLKADAKAVVKNVTEPGKDLGDECNKEKGKENSRGYEQTTGSAASLQKPVSMREMIHEIQMLIGITSKIKSVNNFHFSV
jgi:hypothetical protein